MKTFIIRLEAHDDAVLICDKIAWSGGPRILLVFPNSGLPRLSAVDLNRIFRQADRLGGQLALATRERGLKDEARRLGIPVFSSEAQAQRHSWPLSHRRRALTLPFSRGTDLTAMRAAARSGQMKSIPGWARVLMFILGVVGFLALISLFIPSATIWITPEKAKQELTLQFWANPGVPAALASGGLPAVRHTVLVEDSLEDTGSLTTTIADQSAQGWLVLTNRTDSPVEVPEGSIFLTEGSPVIRFVSSRDATLPAGSGQTAEVPVRALTPGAAGNVPADAIRSVEGRLVSQIEVTNPRPTEGGSDREVRAGSEQDYEMLYDALFTSLAEEALRQLEFDVGEPRMIMRSSLKLEKVIKQVRIPEAGEPADRIRLDLGLEFSALSVAEEDITKAASLALDASLPKGYRPVSREISIRPIGEQILDTGGSVRWQARISRTITTVWKPQEILPWITGRTVPEAAAFIARQLDLPNQPEIVLSPAWFDRLPFVAFRIRLVEK